MVTMVTTMMVADSDCSRCAGRMVTMETTRMTLVMTTDDGDLDDAATMVTMVTSGCAAHALSKMPMHMMATMLTTMMTDDDASCRRAARMLALDEEDDDGDEDSL